MMYVKQLFWSEKRIHLADFNCLGVLLHVLKNTGIIGYRFVALQLAIF